MSDWVSLAEVQQTISHFQLADTDKERQSLTLRAIRSLLEVGHMQIGELPGPDGRFPAWARIEVAMDCLRERFVDHYSEPASWDYLIWLGLTDTGRPVAEALRVNSASLELRHDLAMRWLRLYANCETTINVDNRDKDADDDKHS